MNRIVAIANQKGGVGKTTTAVNLSSALAIMGKKTLLIDLDPQAHSTMGLGIEPGTYQGAIHDVLINKRDIREIIVKAKINNHLDIAPAHIRLDRAEQQLIPEVYRESILERAIRNLTYDFIIIDCRPTLGILTINALKACNFIIVPCEVSRYSLEGFSDLIETIDSVKDTDQTPRESFVRIVLTKYDSRKKVSNDWVMDQLKPYRRMLFKTCIRQTEALNQASMAMEPIHSFRPNSPGADDYHSLTKEFLELCRQSGTN